MKDYRHLDEAFRDKGKLRSIQLVLCPHRVLAVALCSSHGQGLKEIRGPGCRTFLLLCLVLRRGRQPCALAMEPAKMSLIPNISMSGSCNPK